MNSLEARLDYTKWIDVDHPNIVRGISQKNYVTDYELDLKKARVINTPLPGAQTTEYIKYGIKRFAAVIGVELKYFFREK